MRGGIILALILATMGVLVMFGENETIAGIEPGMLASMVWIAAVGVSVAAWVVATFKGQWLKALEAIAFWLALIIALVGGYSYRFELGDFVNRISGALVPGWTVVGRGGEVSVVRGNSSSFILSGEVNHATARFIFDTGASRVVLTRATAARGGIPIDKLSYDTRVQTANGTAMAAATIIDRLTIGSISLRRVEALVAGEGALAENLLGMSFLERLERYEVRGDRLVLRGR